MYSTSVVLGYAGVCAVSQWYWDMQVYVQYVNGTGICRCMCSKSVVSGICRCMYSTSMVLGYAGVCAVSQCIWDMQVYVQ